MPKKAADLTLQELVEELGRRERSDPLAEVYTPTSNQLLVHQSRATVTIVQGANRAGKTTCLVADDLLYCLHRPVHAEMPEGPIMVWYLMPSLGMFQRVIYPILLKLLPLGVVQSFPTRPQPIITFTNGSTLHFLSADMKRRRLQGGKVHKITMDETPDESAFDELQARTMDTHGRIALGYLPDQASGWVDDRLIIPHQLGERPDIDFITMPIADEDTGESLVPWFTKKDIESFKRKWPDPAVQAARIYGKRIRHTGLVFRSKNVDVHHIMPFDLPKHWRRFLVCDPQYYRFGVLWFAVDDHGNYIVTDELFSQSATLRERAERMAAITEVRGKVDPEQPLPVYVDSANVQDRVELNWHFDELKLPLAAMRLPFKKVVDTAFDESMVLRVHSLLETDEDRIYPVGDPKPGQKTPEVIHGAPRLMFFNTLYCTWVYDGEPQKMSRLFWELGRLTWGKNGKPDKKSADGSDLIDCLMYGGNIKVNETEPKREDNSMKDLSPQDQHLWRMIHRYDRMDAIAGRY